MNNHPPASRARSWQRGLVLATLFLAWALPAGGRAQAADYAWKQTDHSLALVDGDRVVWQYNYNAEEGKPYFHPLTLPDGTVLTNLRPGDHRWHRALWHSWKFINGLNYWEENSRGKSQGTTELLEVKAEARPDHSARFTLKLAYHPPDKPIVLTETRTVIVGPPGEDGSFVIEWAADYTAGDKDVLLDRTPIPGEPGGRGYGGYAGFSLRAAKSMRDWSYTDSEGRTEPKEMHGKTAKWVDLSGKTGGIAIFDHPANLRHPAPWYVSAGMPYYSPAPLFHESYTLGKAQTLKLRYAVLIHAGKADLEATWKRLAK